MTFRFGFQLTGEHRADPITAARRAEKLGFDVVLLSDHVGPGPAPMPLLAAMAQATESIRLGTFVLNNDMRNPVQLAWEASTIDHLSGGRFELGLGAGHTPHEYAETGIALQAPAVRKQRLTESVEILRMLLDGQTVDWDSEHYRLEGAAVEAPVQDHLPILVGGNGAALLAHAGAHADIIGLQGLGKTQPDGHSHSVRWTAEHVTRQVDQVRAGALTRFDEVEFNALVQMVAITDDREAALATACDNAEGLTLQDARNIPYLLAGTVDEIAGHIRACRDRWGITYFAVRELDDFASVIAALR